MNNSSNYIKDTYANTSKNIILPFCIYYYQRGNDFYGRISATEEHMDNDNTSSYNCLTQTKLYEGWKYISTFYAISPILVPIPNDMIFICAERKKSYPYNTFKIHTSATTFSSNRNCIYFIVYSKQKENTIPLYFYEIKDDVIIPSMEKKNLKQIRNSPVYTLDPKAGKEKIIQLKNHNKRILDFSFNCVKSGGICIPTKEKGTSLVNCVYTCHKDKPKDIFTMLNEEKKIKEESNKKYTIIIIIIIILAIIILAILLIIFFVNNKNVYYRKRNI